MWPVEVRSDLRSGIKAKQQDDLLLSQRYLQRAWDTAKSLPLQTFGSEPCLKVSGIAIKLAEVLEANGAPDAAYTVYAEALKLLQNVRAADPAVTASKNLWYSSPLPDNLEALERSMDSFSQEGNTETHHLEAQSEVVEHDRLTYLSTNERVRSIALAQKLGEMAYEYGQPQEEEEKWLSYAAEEVFRILADMNLLVRRNGDEDHDVAVSMDEGNDTELVLPPWAMKANLAAPIEALGSFYVRQDKPNYALTLYRFCLIMIRDSPSTENTCRHAQVLNNLAHILFKLTDKSADDEDMATAEKLALQAAGLAQNILMPVDHKSKGDLSAMSEDPTALCAYVLPVALFNLGMMYEELGKGELAKRSFSDSYIWSVKFGVKDATLNASAALRRLEHASTAKTEAAVKSS
ncbi:hypothetical protein BD410DRAFT_839470 [Rickenella mellea]|uniref:TPR-like protein n=1 Tax=Rickenella mellea TaxID=50990 RepID=A0A4Y7Q7A1_9AGAM|nr:hypothetical protein BD410DRAFT_839470 [Rickenella mellea]